MWNFIDKGNGNLLSNNFIPEFSSFKLNTHFPLLQRQDESFLKYWQFDHSMKSQSKRTSIAAVIQHLVLCPYNLISKSPNFRSSLIIKMPNLNNTNLNIKTCPNYELPHKRYQKLRKILLNYLTVTDSEED